MRNKIINLGKHKLLNSSCDTSYSEDLLSNKKPALIFGEHPNSLIIPVDDQLSFTRIHNKPNIVMYSGGKDSLAMMILMKEHGIKIDSIVSFRTGQWEWPELDEHHKKVESFFNIKIDWIDGGDQIEEGFSKYGFPQVFARWCNTIRLKMVTAHINKHFGNANSIVQFVGIAYSERERLMADHYRKSSYRFPLIEHKISENDALQLCFQQGFDFGGIYDKQHRLSCWCCPLTRDAYIFDLINDSQKWNTLRKMQAKSPTPFKLPHKTIYWFEHEYWSRYTRKGISKNVDRFARRDKSDVVILEKTAQYIIKHTQPGDIVLCLDGNALDVFKACNNNNRIFYGVEPRTDYCETIIKEFYDPTH